MTVSDFSCLFAIGSWSGPAPGSVKKSVQHKNSVMYYIVRKN